MPATAGIAPERRRRLERAALRAIAYAELFEYPLTAAEITRFLPGERATLEEVTACLATPHVIQDHLACRDGYYCRRGVERIIETRLQRAAHSTVLWRQARLIARLLAMWPFTRMVAVTGSLAASNSRDGDDIDLLLVTTPGRVWITRLAVVFLGRVLRGSEPCPNFVVSEEAMALVYRDFYAARELALIVPLYGFDVYERLMALNGWTREYLPNAGGITDRAAIGHGLLLRGLKTIGAWIADRLGASWIEAWQRRHQIERARAAGWLDAPGVILDERQCKAHAVDYHSSVTARYLRTLADLGLDPAEDEDAAPSPSTLYFAIKR